MQVQSKCVTEHGPLFPFRAACKAEWVAGRQPSLPEGDHLQSPHCPLCPMSSSLPCVFSCPFFLAGAHFSFRALSWWARPLAKKKHHVFHPCWWFSINVFIHQMAAGLILEMSICVGVMRPGMHFLSVPWTILKCAKLKKKKKLFTYYGCLWRFVQGRPFKVTEVVHKSFSFKCKRYCQSSEIFFKSLCFTVVPGLLFYAWAHFIELSQRWTG